MKCCSGVIVYSQETVRFCDMDTMIVTGLDLGKRVGFDHLIEDANKSNACPVYYYIILILSEHVHLLSGCSATDLTVIVAFRPARMRGSIRRVLRVLILTFMSIAA